jgi:hypothetical protein
LRHTRGSNHNIFGQKNDSMHSQQRSILQQKERTKPSRQTFSPVKQQSIPPNNGAILMNATIIKAVMSSVAEGELGALFLNARRPYIYARYS